MAGGSNLQPRIVVCDPNDSSCHPQKQKNVNWVLERSLRMKPGDFLIVWSILQALPRHVSIINLSPVGAYSVPSYRLLWSMLLGANSSC